MNCIRSFIFLFASLVASLVSWQSAFACECKTDDTVLGNFERATFILIAKAVSVEEVPKVETTYSGNEEIKETKLVVKSTKMVVEKVYKGDLKVGDEMIFGQGSGGASCLWEFDNDVVGNRFLLYLDSKEKKPKVWFVNMCSRSTSIPAASYKWFGNSADDLLFLDNIEKVRGRTRISGTFFALVSSPFAGEVNSYRNFADLKLRIIGNGKTYETTSNKDGVYEIYDLPAGDYTIQPDVPKGWKMDISGIFATNSGNMAERDSLQLTLKPQKHAFYDFHFELNNKISGRVTDSFDNPIEGVCPQLFPAYGKPAEDFVRSRTGCTEKDGSFEIKEVPPGSYKIVVNKENKISSQNPFHTVYYPNVNNAENAKIIVIAEGEDKEGISIRVPESHELITVMGVFLSSDGVPVTNAWVRFIVATTNDDFEGNTGVRTDENGRFSINILKGLEGKLFGLLTLDESQFSSCPQIAQLINGKGRIDWLDKISNTVEIKADKKIDNIELKLPFPSCNRTKIVSRVKID